MSSCWRSSCRRNLSGGLADFHVLSNLRRIFACPVSQSFWRSPPPRHVAGASWAVVVATEPENFASTTRSRRQAGIHRGSAVAIELENFVVLHCGVPVSYVRSRRIAIVLEDLTALRLPDHLQRDATFAIVLGGPRDPPCHSSAPGKPPTKQPSTVQSQSFWRTSRLHSQVGAPRRGRPHRLVAIVPEDLTVLHLEPPRARLDHPQGVAIVPEDLTVLHATRGDVGPDVFPGVAIVPEDLTVLHTSGGL